MPRNQRALNKAYRADLPEGKECMVRVILIAMTTVMVFWCFVPRGALGQGKALEQKGFATAKEAAKALAGAYKSADRKAQASIPMCGSTMWR